jgi:hypothetical protein
MNLFTSKYRIPYQGESSGSAHKILPQTRSCLFLLPVNRRIEPAGTISPHAGSNNQEPWMNLSLVSYPNLPAREFLTYRSCDGFGWKIFHDACVNAPRRRNVILALACWPAIRVYFRRPATAGKWLAMGGPLANSCISINKIFREDGLGRNHHTTKRSEDLHTR